jgi:hypothetical protein
MQRPVKRRMSFAYRRLNTKENSSFKRSASFSAKASKKTVPLMRLRGSTCFKRKSLPRKLLNYKKRLITSTRR